MDPSVSGDPWYPLECICRKMACFVRNGAVAAFMQFIGRCSKSVVFVLSAVGVRCEWGRGMLAYVGRSEDWSLSGSAVRVTRAS